LIGIGEDERVNVCPAGHRACAGPIPYDVAAGAAFEQVIAGAAVEYIGSTLDPVVERRYD
jgi:hypothetical protein